MYEQVSCISNINVYYTIESTVHRTYIRWYHRTRCAGVKEKHFETKMI